MIAHNAPSGKLRNMINKMSLNIYAIGRYQTNSFIGKMSHIILLRFVLDLINVDVVVKSYA